jgi:hypothetical protein
MKPRAISKVGILAIVVLGAASLLLALFVVCPIVVAPARARERLVRLLCETDYRALLRDCREVEARVRRGDLEEGIYGAGLNRKLEAVNFPQGILTIQPSSVIITNDEVILQMQGVPSYGVVAYAEDYPVDRYDLGDVELIPGLWYYDENYHAYADRKDYIDALVAEGKRRNRGNSGQPSSMDTDNR